MEMTGMNIGLLRYKVRKWAADGHMACGEMTPIMLNFLTQAIGVKPVKTQWGASCLYITLPGGVDVNVQYGD